MILQEARTQHALQAEVLYRKEAEANGSLASAVVELKGENLESFLNNWLGTVQWVGESPFRKKHPRKNWFIGVFALDFNEEQSNWAEQDFQYQSMRASGAGGQHVNKVETAVRVTHVKSGLSATCSEERSQHQNKRKARAKLIKMLEIQALEEKKARMSQDWQNHLQLERGNPAVEALNYALSYDDEDPKTLALAAKLHGEQLQDYETAKALYEKALTADIYAVGIYPEYISLLIWTQDYARADQLIDFALTLKGIDQSVMYYFKAYAYEAQGEFKKALAEIKTAKRLAQNACVISYIDETKTRIKGKMPKVKKKKNQVKTKKKEIRKKNA
ncbi:unnamed protein product [Cyprideis torosa]|uniref:Uncharacterized protein n=1 Tax=Cyprideis torosa TaxID=163714 RepID=A0A7R8ZN05_9CRUS|nr:unnamed protein product [Cyprideis torosa]CAG0895119.1 unnamed protein product [Cyprideis torosa]